MHTNIAKMWQTIIFSLLIIAVAIFILGFRVFLTKRKKFPNTHIGRDKNMKARGIVCSVSTDAAARKAKNLNDRIKGASKN